MRYALTLFTYNPEIRIKETTKTKDPGAPEISDTHAVGEKHITTVIAMYGFLNLNHIERCLVMDGHTKIDAKKSLEKMQRTGRVKKYTLSLENSDKQDVDIYILPKKIRDRLKEKGMKLIPYRYDMDNIPYILEHLSLVQWHISVIEHRGISESAYNWRVALDDGRIAMVPSLTARGIKRKFYLCAFPAPRDMHNESLARFITNIFLVDSYFKENVARFRRYAFILICEDDKQAEDLCRYLSGIKETAGLFFLYTNDTMTLDSDPLSMLYSLTTNGKKVERKIYKLT